MKKWIPIFAAALALTFLPGCQSQGDDVSGEPIEAMYIEKGEDFRIFVALDSGSPFTATIPEGTKELSTGDLVKIYGNGIMLESYPGQYPGVTKIELTAEGREEDAKEYQELLDVLYVEPDPSETPYLNLEYSANQANVTAVTAKGGVSWTYEDENGETKSYIADVPFILDWKELNDIRLGDPTDVTLHFSDKPKKVTVIRYDRKSKEELKETKSSGETENENDEVKGEMIEVTSEESGEDGSVQYMLKELYTEGVYLVTAEFEQGTVEYGFEVLSAEKEE